MRKFVTGLGLAVLVAAQGISASPAIAASSIEISSAQVLQQLAAASASKAFAPGAATAKVANDVRAALDAGARPDVLLHFHGKADLSDANRIPAEARAAFVHRTLSDFAAGVQAPARSALQGFGRHPSHLSDGAGYMVLWLTNSIAVSQATEAEIAALAQTPGIARIVQQQVIPPQPEIEAEAIPPFSLNAVEASIAQISAPDVWALGFQGAGITVGNVDSGVRHTHQALVNQYRGNTGSGFEHNYNWFDPYSFSTAPRNTGSHGSHTMGTMVGDDGGTNQVGVAPQADWVACIGFGGAGGSATDAGLIACNQWMVAPTDLQGNNPNPALAAHVSNNSWGNTLCNGAYDNWYEGAVDGLIAAGVVPVWSMGNASNCGLPNNPPLGQNSSPSNYGKVLSVGSTGNSNGTYAGHSIKGPTSNPSLGLPDYPDHFGFADLKPNVMAPGVAIRSTIASSDTAYGLSNGTSMSAPAVAGMVALMWNAAPCLIGDYATTGSLIMSTATPIPMDTGSPSDGPGNVPNQATGWGEVNALAAVNAALQHCAVVGGPDPVILVSPLTINLSVFEGDVGSTGMTIANIAGGTLDWTATATATAGSCASPTPVAWLSLAPAGGSNGSGVSTQVTVSADAGALEIGDYDAVICVASNDSTGDTLIEVPVNLTVADPDVFPLPYCEVTVDNDIEPISRVVFAGIDNSSSPVVNGPPAHEDFRSVVGNVETGATYSMRVEGNTAGNFTTHVTTYFDWNRDGDFSDAGESSPIGTIVNSNGTDGINATAPVTIPASVTTGPVRMRVAKQWNVAPPPCGAYSYGQAEDYTVQVTQVVPEIALAPSALSFDTTIGGSESQDLSISNVGTGTLNWAIGTANVTPTAIQARIGGPVAGAVEFGTATMPPRKPGSVLPMADCAAFPGQIVHDDGSVENGYSGSLDAGVTEVRVVDLFTPAGYPVQVGQVCVAFLSQGPTSMDYEVVVYDDDGAGGSPGTLLGSLDATATALPGVGSLPTPGFYTVDLSPLAIEVTEGSVYIGVSFAPQATGANVFIASDESAGNPVGFAGGYFFTDVDGTWGPIEASFADYRSLMVRAVLLNPNPEGCEVAANIPWLSVGTVSGSTGPGETDLNAISVDATGMAPGVYDALLCVSSNDATDPLIEYPVELRVRPATIGANIEVAPSAIAATLGDTQIIERSIAVSNIGGTPLDWQVSETSLLAAGSALLYAQDGNTSSSGALSLDDLSSPDYATQAADDFSVPAGGLWVVDRVVAGGFYEGLVNPAAAVNVSFHADAGGAPGAVVAAFDGLVPSADDAGELTLDLPDPVSLEEGTWWVSVQPAMDYFDDGRWYWLTETVASGAEFHWQNPGGGYGACPSWSPGSTVCGVAANADLTFSLYGAGADASNCVLPGWISIDPLSGTTASGATSTLAVTLDSTGLADGVHSAAVCIDSNDPIDSRVVVPVNITVDNALQQPVIDVAPDALSFEVPGGDIDAGQFIISNLGSGPLNWMAAVPVAGGGGPDPLLDEIVAIPNFSVGSVPNGGEPAVFTLPAGVLTSGKVVGFTFKGTVANISGATWATDMCMLVTSPDGTTYGVGGFSGILDGCDEHTWNGVGSGNGTYTSAHPGTFNEVDDGGDWTFTFINDWNSTSAATMNWSNVSVTLHKVSSCNGGGTGWLNLAPTSGSTYNGAPDQLGVTVDTSGLLAGDYEGTVCINSNDSAGNAAITVPVLLTVLGPEISVAPASISDTLDIGASGVHPLTISNLGVGELTWSAEEAPNALAGDTRAHFPTTPYLATGSRAGQSALGEPADPVLMEKLARSLPVNRPHGTALVPSYSGAGFSRSDYVTLDAEVPGALTSITDPGPNDIYAATFVNNDFSRQFFIATGGGDLPDAAYGWVDTATGAVTQLGVVSGGPAGATWTTPAWDPASGNIFAVSFASTNQLWTVDPTTGTASLVGTLAGAGLPPDAIVIGSAFDAAGLLYVLDLTSDSLVAVDKADATAAVIGPTGVAANFAQDMDFDRSTGVLYWAGYQGGGNSQMFTIDPATGDATAIGNIQDGAELISFRVATAGGGCAAPADVPWISLDSLGGTIAGGGADQTINVTLDASALPVGVHQASICIDSNDVQRPTVEVPVTLNVQTPQPFIEVTPESLSTVIGIGLSDTQQLQVANLGYTNDLVWTVTEELEGGAGDCSVTGDVTWLSTSTSGDTTAAGNSTPIDVTFDATAMADGIYTTNLCIASNDLLQPLVIVPVTMEVDETIGTPDIAVAPPLLEFDVALNGTAAQDLSITNNGTGALNWTIGAGLVEPMNLSREARAARDSANPADRSRSSNAAPAERRRRDVTLFGGDPLQVVVLSPDTTPPQGMVDDLNGFPDIDAELFAGPVTGVTAAALEPYDVVVTVNNNQWAAAGADVIVGDALADYVDAGGKVVVFSYSLDNVGWELAGRFITEGYAPLEMATADVSVPATMNIVLPDHPIADGVVSLSTTGLRQVHAVRAGAELIAEWSDGQPLVAANDSVVAFNELYEPASWTGDLDLLLHNSVVWLAAGNVGGGCGAADSVDWLGVSAPAGVALALETDLSSISVDAAGMAPGTYEAQLCVASNDADAPVVNVPVTLNITSADPFLTLAPASLDSELGSEATDVQQLAIGNLGQADLDWSIVEEPEAVRGTMALLYGQTSNPGTDGPEADYDLDDEPNWIAQAADDFSVPAGDTWSVTRVFARGEYDDLPAPGVDVFIYADAAGQPGAELSHFSGLIPVTDVGGALTIDLPSAVVLTEGTYWVSVQPVMDFFDHGNWFWLIETVVAGEEFYFRGGPDAYPSCTDWTSGSDCFGTSPADLGFEIYGTVESGTLVCTAPADMPWVSVAPASGATAEGATSLVDVTFTSVGMADGTYEGNLCLTSDDPNRPLTVIPLTLVVDETIGTPEVAVTPAALSFDLMLGETDAADLDIANTGTGRLDWILGGEPVTTGMDPVARSLAWRALPVTATFGRGNGGLQERTGDVINVGDTQMSQTTNTTIVPANSVGCPTGPNALYRRFYFSEHAGLEQSAEISSVDVAIQEAAGSTSLTVNLYTLPSSTPVDTIPVGALVPIGTANVPISGANDNGTVNVPVSGIVADGVANDLVVEVVAQADFFIGATNAGETHPGFIAGPACGLVDPTPIASIDPAFANTHIIMVVNADPNVPACAATETVPWLAIGTASGQVLGGQSEASTISVDTAGLAPGTYQANLCVASNAANDPLVEVPVTLTVSTEVTVSPETVPDGTVGIGYGTQFTATGPGTTPPFAFVVTDGALPDGTVLATDGNLSGMPTTAGSFTFTVTATDSSTHRAPYSGGRSYTMSVAQGTQVIDFAALPPRSLDDGPFDVAATASSGLSVAFSSNTTGTCTVAGTQVTLVATGICTILASQPGDANWLAATDVTRSFVIQPGAVVTVEIGPDDLPVGKLQQEYLATFTASGTGTTAPFTYAVTAGSLPMGVELSATGELSGTPVESGDFTFTISATDSTAAPTGPFTGVREYTLVVLGDAVFYDGFETQAPVAKMADGAEALSVPLLDLLAGGSDGRLVTAAVLMAGDARIGLVQARCAASTCEVRVLHETANGGWTQGDWWLVADEPFELQLFIENSRITEATRGRMD